MRKYNIKTLDDIFVSSIQDAYKQLVVKLISEKLDKLGIQLTEQQYDKLKVQIENRELESLTIEADKDQLKHYKLDPGERLKLDIDQNDLEKLDEAIDQVTDEFIHSGTTEISTILLDEWKSQSSKLLKKERAIHSQFQDRVRRSWGKALDLLDMLIGISYDAGAEFNDQFRQEAKEKNDYIFEALTRLHARGCQVGLEILTLLKSGYADGAHARWRTLHELTVTAYFILNNGNDIAERYLCHAGITNYKEAREYQKHCEALHYEPFSDDVLKELESKSKNLIARFGREFGNDYGWAESTLGIRNPNFSQIEAKVNLNHIRFFYKMASDNVHAGSKGIAFRLGLAPTGKEVLLAGPSIFGLADPGRNTALSINQLTTFLLTTKPNLERLAFIAATRKLAEEAFYEFDEAEGNCED